MNVGATVNFTKDWNLEFDYTYANREFLWDRPEHVILLQIHGQQQCLEWMQMEIVFM